MPILSGKRLGPFEILVASGAGGMGEVYRAKDIRLNRDVALKVLPEVFAADPDRMARFEREARVLAALNHRHIAVIYGLEESGSTNALVMELVEGPTLANRIAAGPLPLDGDSESSAVVEGTLGDIPERVAKELPALGGHGRRPQASFHKDIAPRNSTGRTPRRS